MPKEPVILFRADAGPGHGAGHVMRSLALAEAFASRAAEPVLVTASDEADLLEEWRARGFGVDLIEPAADEGTDEQALLDASARRAAGLAILDGYHFSAEYGRRLQDRAVRVARLSDAAIPEERALAADIIINPNPGADGYKPSDVARYEGVKLLFGAQYALVRGGVRRVLRSGGDGVLITFGASDSANVGLVVARSLLAQDRDATMKLVCSAGPKGYEEARRLSEQEPLRLRVQSPTDIAPLMALADVAVCAGGVTALELCAVGVPFVSMPVADNQRLGVQAMAARGATIAVTTPAAAARELASLLAEPDRAEGLSRAGRALIDGMGAERVADAILRMM